ncbi:3'-5' exonuclease [Clostridium intestinale]|uniref:3'-5' exonuclease n=1 Tax=Clostridium intestinale TaxID=36845 RepID=UPI002DD63080|nr:3'-5' exonuclease [Clostridium intestinale]WRY53944.1 3'-5' exonuclease [Clostridium intestinale]
MKILFIDCETGGLNPEKHSLLTIGLAVYEYGKIVAEKEIDIRHKEYIVTAKALKINNINLVQHDTNAKDPKIVVQEIIEFIKENFKEEKPVIGGHNVEFDIKFIERLFSGERDYFNRYVSHRKLDTCSIINFLMLSGKIDIESASLEAAIKYFDIETNSRHTALEDTKAAIKLYEKLKKFIWKENF